MIIFSRPSPVSKWVRSEHSGASQSEASYGQDADLFFGAHGNPQARLSGPPEDGFHIPPKGPRRPPIWNNRTPDEFAKLSQEQLRRILPQAYASMPPEYFTDAFHIDEHVLEPPEGNDMVFSRTHLREAMIYAEQLVIAEKAQMSAGRGVILGGKKLQEMQAGVTDADVDRVLCKRYGSVEKFFQTRDEWIDRHIEEPCIPLVKALIEKDRFPMLANAFSVGPKGVYWQDMNENNGFTPLNPHFDQKIISKSLAEGEAPEDYWVSHLHEL